MIQEDKGLLLGYLSMALPYKVKVTTTNPAVELGVISGISIENKISVRTKHADIVFNCTEVKPYLRPISSMTEEEYNELKVIAHGCDYVLYYSACFPVECNARFKTYKLEVIDWLNAHHFDYRGLIKKGLAIAVNEENNPYK